MGIAERCCDGYRCSGLSYAHGSDVKRATQ
jgi:hypothetical protein